jgi:hypothetical protein
MCDLINIEFKATFIIINIYIHDYERGFIYIYKVLKVLQALRGYSTHQKEQQILTDVLRTVRQHLHYTFGEQWIGCRGTVNWTARSPVLNPLDFWLWGHLKTSVYSVPINDIDIIATSRECLSDDSRETRNFRQSARVPLCDEELKVV